MSITIDNSKTDRELVREAELQIKRLKSLNKELTLHACAISKAEIITNPNEMYANKKRQLPKRRPNDKLHRECDARTRAPAYRW